MTFLWWVFVCMVAATAGALILDELIEGVRDLVAEWREGRS